MIRSGVDSCKSEVDKCQGLCSKTSIAKLPRYDTEVQGAPGWAPLGSMNPGLLSTVFHRIRGIWPEHIRTKGSHPGTPQCSRSYEIGLEVKREISTSKENLSLTCRRLLPTHPSNKTRFRILKTKNSRGIMAVSKLTFTSTDTVPSASAALSTPAWKDIYVLFWARRLASKMDDYGLLWRTFEEGKFKGVRNICWVQAIYSADYHMSMSNHISCCRIKLDGGSHESFWVMNEVKKIIRC